MKESRALMTGSGRMMNSLVDIQHHDHDSWFIHSTLEEMPFRFRKPISKRYSRAYQQQGRRDANLFLLDTLDKMPDSVAVRLAGSDHETVRYASHMADQSARATARLGEAALDPLSETARSMGIVPPEPGGEVTHQSALERLQDSMWWRRAIRKTQGRKVEQAARDVGLVHKGAGIYSSEETLFRRDEQKSRNRLMLEEVIAVNELGQEYTLAELSDLSVSNPVIRRGELMTRIAGFEQVANDLKHRALFITLTCPSRFHSHTIRNNKSVENPRYDGSTPREAQQYLQSVWARIRAKLYRCGIHLYGFRVAEPNHDGCVHWHLLVFAPGWANRRIQRTFREHALRDSSTEPGAKKHRVTFVEIDPAKGTARGYIAKYIAKNIDGHALDQDLFGGDPIEAAARVDAWASCWGIRQFQQLGGPPVTVWRELRRIEGEESGVLETARDAADRGDWAAFVQAMGGPTCPRQSHPVKLAKATDLIDIDEST
ncbi:MAG: replication endonuclease, partial [Candidatus Thiodiazotropha sp.]